MLGFFSGDSDMNSSNDPSKIVPKKKPKEKKKIDSKA